MATRRVCLHLGAHKTATSLVQGYLGQPGRPGRAVGIGHLGRGETGKVIGWGPPLIAQPERLALRIAREAARRTTRVVFLSHEDVLGRPFTAGGAMYGRARPGLEALARVVADYEVELILTIRPQSQFLESYYLQRVQEGCRDSFAKWFEQIDCARLSWRPIVRTLLDTFAGAPLTLIDFRALKLGQQAFLSQFLEHVLPDHGLDAHYYVRHNTSLSEKGLAIQLAANRCLPLASERELVRHFLQEHFSNERHPRPTLLDPQQARAIDAPYAAEYEALLTAFAAKGRGPVP